MKHAKHSFLSPKVLCTIVCFFVVLNFFSCQKKADTSLTSHENPCVLSPDVRHYAFVTKIGKRAAVSHDETLGKSYDEIEILNITFSPDSKHLMYCAGELGKGSIILTDSGGFIIPIFFIVLDGIEYKEDIDSLVKYGKALFDSNDSFHYITFLQDVGYKTVQKKIRQ